MWFEEMTRVRIALVAAFVVSLLAAALPAALCVFELRHLQESIAKIDEAAARVKQTRDVVDKIGQTLVGFTAIALDLSDQERSNILAEADRQFAELGEVVGQVTTLAENFLSKDQQEKLGRALDDLTHSREEIREESPSEISPTEKTFHFLQILHSTKVARDLLVKVEAAVAQAAEGETQASFARLTRAGTLVVAIILIGAIISIIASLGVYYFALATRRTNVELDRTRAFLDTVIENVPATIAVKDARDLRYVLVNRAGERHYGLPRDQIIGKTPHDIFPQASADFITARDRQSIASGTDDFCERHSIETPGAGTRIVKSSRLPIRGSDGRPQYVLSVIDDVTEREQAEQRIAHMAHHDALTDLPNRAAFTERLQAILGRAVDTKTSFAVLCMDLDRFKEVNDVFGHSVGDTLLREVSRRLSEAAHGAFLARLGGDEFTLIAAEGPQPSTAAALAERLIAAMADDLEIEGHRLHVGLSIGVAIYPADGADAATLLANADAALYRAKADGRGAIRLFEADMDRQLRERRALQHELRAALENDELVLHYQPQASIDGRIEGLEALVRWRHPTRGLIAPAIFIPAAEESGLIIAMGEWVLRQACCEAASWPKQLQIAVNLSPVQFRHGDLPGLVHAVLLETGLAPDRLELEITEGVLIGDFSRAVSILRRLKALGVRIAMDDFGTGYSSLSYLQAFPFDKIKIDRSFISNLDRNTQSAAIIRAVIGLGRGLSLPVVAEGVENDVQLAFLAREECSEVQGYLVGRPYPIENYAEVVGRRRDSAAKAVSVS